MPFNWRSPTFRTTAIGSTTFNSNPSDFTVLDSVNPGEQLVRVLSTCQVFMRYIAFSPFTADYTGWWEDWLIVIGLYPVGFPGAAAVPPDPLFSSADDNWIFTSHLEVKDVFEDPSKMAITVNWGIPSLRIDAEPRRKLPVGGSFGSIDLAWHFESLDPYGNYSATSAQAYLGIRSHNRLLYRS